MPAPIPESPPARSDGSSLHCAPLHVGKFIPPPYAGIEAHVDTLLRSLVGRARPTLVASRLPGQDLSGREWPYRLLPVASHGSLASVAVSPGMLTTIRRELRSGRANLLHLHAPNPWGDLAALMRPASVPVVMTWHSDIVRQKRLLALYGPVQRRALDRSDRIVVFTPAHYASSTQLQGRGIDKKLVTIPLGIDFSRLDDTPRAPELLDRIDRWALQRPVILTVGRHIYYKGYGYLLEAVSRLRSDAVLVMVGTGPQSDNLQSQVRELGLSERVQLLGEVGTGELVSLLHRCDLFTLPSIEPSEAFGIATAEAMACGKPSVVCQLGNGVNYLNRHGVTGLATAPRDVSALADALDTLALDASLRARMGEAARQWVRSEFSIETMRDRTLDLYRSLL